MTGDETGAVRSVVIVGRGSAAWLAAIALHRAHAVHGLRVTVVETPGLEPSQNHYTTTPEIHAFHRRLGIAESELVRHAGGVFVSAHHVAGWSGEGSGFMRGFGNNGAAIAGFPLAQFWAKARRGGMVADLADFNLSAVAARHGRLACPTGDEGYALNLDAAGYLAVLRRHAAALHILRIAEGWPVVVAGGDGIAKLQLQNGAIVTADLYVDATGADGRLIGTVDPAAPSAAAILPCDRVICASAEAAGDTLPFGSIRAHGAGWIATAPLADRTGVTFAYARSMLSDDEAAATAVRLTGGRVGFDMVVRDASDRLLQRPWVGNCVAIGAAAGGGEPLDAVDLRREQLAIAHLVALLPVDRNTMREAGIYNDEVPAFHRRMRDYQAAYYRLNRRRGEPFWDAARVRASSRELEDKIALFAARGMIVQHDRESFTADSWQSLFAGMGVVPRTVDPRVAAVSEHDTATALQSALRSVGAMVRTLPRHSDTSARIGTR